VRSTFSGTRFAGWYFAVQGVAIAGWWLYLTLRPGAVRLFVPPGAQDIDLIAFRLPDLLVAVPASLIAAVTFFARSRWAVPLGWLAAGAMDYAFFYCLAWTWHRQGGWLSVVLMAPAALLSTVSALDTSAEHLTLFRRAAPGPPGRHVAATLIQIVLFWSFFLLVVPFAIRTLEREQRWPTLEIAGQRPLAATLFLLFSALGVTSGMTMAVRGAGTPLPFDAPNRLVVLGPYAYIRNPMVVAGLGQGFAVALWLGSASVLAYVLLGALLWNYLVRPAEERDLHQAFGDEYASYCRHVRCWIPRLRRFVPGTSR
jgi:protein-S-isoprenylcysteine O-methyltransferase Ste14